MAARTPTDAPPPVMVLFDALTGVWRGSGAGDFPTMEPFEYDEEIVFTRLTNRHLRYHQQARDHLDGETLHVECGIWRVTRDHGLEVTIALPGVAEVAEGAIDGTGFDGTGVVLTSSIMSRAPQGAPLVGSVRRYRLAGDLLTYDIAMGTAEQPVQPHIEARLVRVT